MRLIVGILGALACALFSSHRSSLSVAIVSMARYNASEKGQNNTGECHSSSNTTKQGDSDTDENNEVHGDFDWDQSMQGLILGASFYMYLITPTIAGRITERFGAKWVTTVSVIAPAVIHALIPSAAYYSVKLLIGLLVIQGLFHGCIFASLFSLFANWFTPSERTVAIASLAAGQNLGNLVTFPLAGYLCEHGFAGGWPSVFYVISLAHIPWVVLWLLYVHDTPAKSNQDGFIKCSDNELTYLQNNIKSFGAPKSSSTAPWRMIFTSRCVWAVFVCKITASWGYYLILTRLPSYLDKVFGLSLFHNGLFNAMTSLATGITMALGGPLSAFVIKKTEHKISRTTVRKIFESIAMLGPAICLATITGMGCNSTAVIALLITALFLYGFVTGGEFSIYGEFAPDFAATVFGMAATLSAVPSFIVPYVVGVMVEDSPGQTSLWNSVFYLTVGIYTLGAIVFNLFASAEPQSWGLISKK